MIRRSGARFTAAILVVLAGAACGDSGPEGPGGFTAVLDAQGPPAGAVIVEVTGPGITGFEGTGDTQVFSTVLNAQAGTHRIIAVSASGSIGFRVQVERVELGAPGVVVVDATELDNDLRGPAGLSVRFID